MLKRLSNKISVPLIVTSVNLAARFGHLFFFVIIGNKYGSSLDTDGVIKILSPLAILTSVASSTADAIVMPVFHRSKNSHDAKYLFLFFLKRIITCMIPSSMLIIIASSIIYGYLDFAMMAILMPIPTLVAFSSLKSGMLNASNRFTSAMIGPLFGSATAIIFLLFSPTNIYCFGMSFLFFEIGKSASLYFCRDISTGGFSIKSNVEDEIINWGTRNARLQILNSLILAFGYPIDIWFAGQLEAGSATLIEYANKLWNIVPMLFVGHIAIEYSIMSKKHAGSSIKGYKINIHKKAIYYSFFGIFVSGIVAYFSNFIIDIIFGFGKISQYQQNVLSNLLRSYLLGAGIYVGSLIYVRAMSACGRTDLMLIVVSIGILMNIIFDAIFIYFFGVAGIGISTSAVYICNFISLAFLYEKNRNKISLAL